MRCDDTHTLLVISFFWCARTFLLGVLLVYDFMVFVLRVLIKEVRLLIGGLCGYVVGHIHRVVIHFLLRFFQPIGLGAYTRVLVAWVAGFHQFVMFYLPALRIGIHTGLVFVLLCIRTILRVGI